FAALAWVAWYCLWLPGAPHRSPLLPLTEHEQALAARLRMHVIAIASEPHNIDHYPALERAAAYIEHTLESLGYEPGGQIIGAGGRAVRNIDATRGPTSATTATPTIVIGAHYDSCWVAPGANDNGSGVAAVLELARLLSDWQPKHKRLRLAL